MTMFIELVNKKKFFCFRLLRDLFLSGKRDWKKGGGGSEFLSQYNDIIAFTLNKNVSVSLMAYSS